MSMSASFGPHLAVAETGSVWLSETELQVNSLAFLAQHLLALLDPGDIVGNLHHAYGNPRFKTARYAVWSPVLRPRPISKAC